MKKNRTRKLHLSRETLLLLKPHLRAVVGQADSEDYCRTYFSRQQPDCVSVGWTCEDSVCRACPI